jgi:hypothetical protein
MGCDELNRGKPIATAKQRQIQEITEKLFFINLSPFFLPELLIGTNLALKLCASRIL